MSGFSPTDAWVRAARLAGPVALLASLILASPAAAQSANQKIQSDVFAARTGLPRAWVVSNKPGIVVAIRDRDAPRAPGEKIRLQGEVVDDEAVERLGYHSMRSVVEINCESRRDRVVEMEVFSSPNLQGTGQKRTVPGGWVQPSPDAYMADVIRTVCRSTPRAPQTAEAPEPKPAPTPKPNSTAASARAIAARPRPAAPEPIRRILEAQSMVHLTMLPPEARVPESAEAPITTAQRVPRMVAVIDPPPTATPRPAPEAGTAAVRTDPDPATVAPPQSKPAIPIPKAVAGGLTVQVGALDSEDDAHRALRGFSGLTAGFTTTVQAAKVGDRTFYRALVSGFADKAAAQAFCAQVTHKGGTCLIR